MVLFTRLTIIRNVTFPPRPQTVLSDLVSFLSPFHWLRPAERNPSPWLNPPAESGRCWEEQNRSHLPPVAGEGNEPGQNEMNGRTVLRSAAHDSCELTVLRSVAQPHDNCRPTSISWDIQQFSCRLFVFLNIRRCKVIEKRRVRQLQRLASDCSLIFRGANTFFVSIPGQSQHLVLLFWSSNWLLMAAARTRITWRHGDVFVNLSMTKPVKWLIKSLMIKAACVVLLACVCWSLDGDDDMENSQLYFKSVFASV